MTLSTVQLLYASLRSIGCTWTMVACGVYLSRKGFVSAQTSKNLSNVSMQLTIPCLLFTSILNCTQDWDPSTKCPELRETLRTAWPLMVLPLWYVTAGILVGKLAATLSNAPEDFRKVAVAAVAFGNSTGMPITLLTVIHSSFPRRSELGKVDPVMYLSVYLLTYPILQWGIGSNVLQSKDTPSSQTSQILSEEASITQPLCANMESGEDDDMESLAPTNSMQSMLMLGRKMVSNGMQPPVVASLLGLVVALFPGARGLLVDTADHDDDRPMEWLFDGIRKVGQAAVPINMIILGASLSRGANLKEIPLRSNIAVLISKMVVMPAIGVGTYFFLKAVFDIDENIDASVYLVVLIVTCTPTANNVLVMADVAGQNKQALAACIFTQYMAAPLLLTVWLSIFVALVQQE
ncbi:hypothetical protein CYMTET_4108 [Cymbomonas tetramitiformis]|uniref:Auxin efflux carrier n=1 Tax=Cymbomonas tetramitiformis TaxID=36881 RepID=A0AAE0H1U4_9CHLO|nr:hypothetical protein CYMTET_4108 [Cymbomonas tetramitiformis]